jgi:IS30 family transposase
MKYQQLTVDERYAISAMRGQGSSAAVIAQRLERHPSTIHREVARNRSEYDGHYRAGPAGEKTRGRRSRSRRNQRFGPSEFQPVERLLREQLSPQQIVGRAKLEGVKLMSHETIYCWIWKDKRHGGSLWQHLRGARKLKRKRYGRYDSRGRLAGKKMISQRPPIVDQRSRLGDWEIDTVHGRGKACVVTVVERKSGLVRIGQLPRATGPHTLSRTVQILRPDQDRLKTITSDNGAEFHIYKQIEAQLRATFYFATPHHAWERGSNENTNGLIRQYLPKGSNLKTLTQPQCVSIADQLNNRPRLRLGFKTPNEVYYVSSPQSRRAASCGKLFGSCPRKRPNGSASMPNAIFNVALQT